jgi:predicted ATPase/DNA-binding CsgD family transcriptional regulator
VLALLRHIEVRLLTLTGPGGVGKTRLALQAAANLAGEFVDGLPFISLAAVTDPDLVIPTIARDLGLREEGKRPYLDRLIFHCQDKQQLLILDNFEQIIAAAPHLTGLLKACPDLKLLVTSRERLHVQGEHEFAVPLLPLPDITRLKRASQDLTEVLAENTAVSLFVQRAQAVRPDFKLNGENALSIVQICQRLDGLPLAIELAAARVKLFSPQALWIHLSQATEQATLSLLTGGPRDIPQRQQTLHHTIQWSYDLLSAEEQRWLRALSVFAGGFTLAAAQSVVSNQLSVISDQSTPAADNRLPITDYQLLNTLSSLINKSLLQQSEVQGEPRFSMLVMIREFAAEKLAVSGEATAVHQAHAAYYLQLAETAMPHLRTAQQEQWLAQLEQEHENFRAALAHLLNAETGAETAVRLGSALWHFWLLHGYLSEGHQWLEKIYNSPLPPPPSPLSPRPSPLTLRPSLFAPLLLGTGVLNYYQGNPQRAVSLLQEAARLFETLNDKAGTIAAQQGLARVAMRGGQYEQALALYQQSLALSREIGDTWGIAHAMSYLGLTHWNKGDFVGARPFLEEGLTLFRQIGDAQSTAQALQALAFVDSTARNLTAAQALFNESLILCRRLGDKAGTGRALYGLGLIATLHQKPLPARDFLAEALALWQELGDHYHFCGCLALVASLALHTGQTALAVTLWSAVNHFMPTIGSAPPAQVEMMRQSGQEQARTRLSEPAFAAAWAEGQRVSWDQAYEIGSTALAQIGEAPAASPTNYPAGLTEREVQVLQLLAQGLTNAQIADKLVVSPYTINAHLRTIYNKLDVPSRAAATRFTIEHNLVR